MIATTTITGELLQGAVDGVNKIFYSTFPIYTITEVLINGLPTTLYRKGYNTITFDTAPSIGEVVSLTYQTISDITTKELRDTKNFGELIDSTYLMFGRDIDRANTVYPLELLKRYINEEYISILDNYTSNERANTIRYPAINSSTITSADSNSITLNSLPNLTSYSGYGFTCKNGFFSYNSVLDTTLQEINGFNGVLSTGEVFLGIRLPEDLQRTLEVKLNGLELEYVDLDRFRTGYYGFNQTYTIYNGFLFISNGNYTDRDYIDVIFEPVTYELVDDSDIPKIPSIYVNLLSYKAGERMMRFREDSREDGFRLDYEELKRAFNKRVRQNTKQKVQRPRNLNFLR